MDFVCLEKVHFQTLCFKTKSSIIVNICFIITNLNKQTIDSIYMNLFLMQMQCPKYVHDYNLSSAYHSRVTTSIPSANKHLFPFFLDKICFSFILSFFLCIAIGYLGVSSFWLFSVFLYIFSMYMLYAVLFVCVFWHLKSL